MATQGSDDRQAQRDDLTELFGLLKGYARQETVDPLRGIGRYLAFGAAGAFLIALGLILVAIGGLRLLQTETTAFRAGWSFAPYLIVVVAAAAIAGVFASRITKGDADG